MSNRKTFCGMILALLAVFIVACTAAKIDTSYVDQSTAEKTVQSLIEALNRGDWQAVRTLAKPGDRDSEPYLEQFEKFTKRGGQSQSTNIKIDVVEETAAMTRIQIRGHIKVIDSSGKVLSDYDTGSWFSLVKMEGYWYFISLGQPVPPGWIQNK